MRSPVCDKWTLVLNQNPVIIVGGCHGGKQQRGVLGSFDFIKVCLADRLKPLGKRVVA